MAPTETKRANFDLTPEQEEILASLRLSFSASSTKDTVLRAAQVATLLVKEMRGGNLLFVGRSPAQAMRLVIPELEANVPAEWQWLVERSHPWRRQLWIKGRKLLASAVWLDAQINELSIEEAAENWDLPVAGVEEAFRYSELNQELIKAEAHEERCRLLHAGKAVEPIAA